MVLAERVSKIKPSPTLAVSAKADKMKADGIDIISFGAGEPDFDTPQNIKDAAINALNQGFTKYTAVDGIQELKDAIINKFQRQNGLTYERKQIIVSCGGKHTIYNIAQALFNNGDEVIIPSPYWVSFPDIVLLADATPVIVTTREKNEFKILPEELREAITARTKAIILNSPSNPTGTVYTAEELRKIAEIAVEKKLIVISDEIYEEFVYDGLAFTSIASLGKEIKDLTIVVNGVSKAYSMTGWRIGYAGGPQEIISAMSKIQSQSTSNPTSISQKASVEALMNSHGAVNTMVEEFNRRRKYMAERLNSINGVSCLNPMGAFYAFPRVSPLYSKRFNGKKIQDSTGFADFLLDVARVAVVPGLAFGDDNHIRLSYATSFENIKNGLDRIEEAIKQLE
ncbi:MAG: aspartate aminotransferase [Deltaproteobacteria bacterium CG_4_9_14_3_um_filter_44_9]|nr:MAG: aspartate aminotransferase [Deltaproteobacteria bacterium CG2_30_43_15]PIX23546.1 MAG: aspartate aminotransferase [Deltaproteobacteria bacterium CG_4_8_14_3_um_filter_43_13]PIZ19521.1 MAG: aspartate aminotransferase [Deltaproteobacteria bacterium CG_4_10_14_0_8_um_filter_43_12]PJB40214.1 MAG: aspartate aminotransferase [Deltaproteobacteria bacterium CG_4_9_14_3_um_filter_44_9]